MTTNPLTSKIGPDPLSASFLKTPLSYADSVFNTPIFSNEFMSKLASEMTSPQTIPLITGFLSDPQVIAKLQSLNPSMVEQLVSNPSQAVITILNAMPQDLKDKYAVLTQLPRSTLSGQTLQVLAAPYLSEINGVVNSITSEGTAVNQVLDGASAGAFSLAIKTTANRYLMNTAAGLATTPEVLITGAALTAYALSDDSIGTPYGFASMKLTSDNSAHLAAVERASFPGCDPLLRSMGIALTPKQFRGLLLHTGYKESHLNTSAVNQSVQEAVVIRATGSTSFKKVSRRKIIEQQLDAARRRKDVVAAAALVERLRQAKPIGLSGATPSSAYPVGKPGDMTIPANITELLLTGDHFLAVDKRVKPESFMIYSTAVGMFQLVGSTIADVSQRLKAPIRPFADYINQPYFMINLEASLFVRMFKAISNLGLRFDDRLRAWVHVPNKQEPSGIIKMRMIGPLGDLHHSPYAGLLFLLQMAWVNGTLCLTNSEAHISHSDRLWDLRGTVHIDKEIDKSYSSSDAKAKFEKFIN